MGSWGEKHHQGLWIRSFQGLRRGHHQSLRQLDNHCTILGFPGRRMWPKHWCQLFLFWSIHFLSRTITKTMIGRMPDSHWTCVNYQCGKPNDKPPNRDGYISIQDFFISHLKHNVGIAIINHPPNHHFYGWYKPSKMGGLLLLYPHYTYDFFGTSSHFIHWTGWGSIFSAGHERRERCFLGRNWCWLEIGCVCFLYPLIIKHSFGKLHVYS